MFTSKRLSERAQGLKAFRELVDEKGKVLITHYSCESFVTSHGRTPRITAICVRNLATGQTRSFSIHLQAQFEKLDFNNLTSAEYDFLEKKLLTQFYEFVEKHRDHRWLHWNMRDANYGFEAIANRFRILGGTAIDIPEDRKYDLARIIGQLYTFGFEKNEPRGRFLNLAERNNITSLHALTGRDEAAAYDAKEYLKLHMSTLRKVDIMDTLVNRIENGSLKVQTTVIGVYGLTVPGIIEIVRNSWILLLACSLLGYLVKAAVEPRVQAYMSTHSPFR